MSSTELRNDVVECPHCNFPIVIQQINCAIFRHGAYKTTGQQIDPHAPKEVCDRLVAEKQIEGCGKPFRVVFDASNVLTAVVCPYI